jgi:hypothetical protein
MADDKKQSLIRLMMIDVRSVRNLQKSEEYMSTASGVLQQHRHVIFLIYSM